MSLEDIHMNTKDLLEKKQLDAGGFGTISLCVHKKHGYVVLKKVYTGPQRTEYNVSLLEEGRIMRRLQHDRVVKLLGVILEDGNYSLVMEYVDRGNMMKVLQNISVPLSVRGRFVLEITEGMLYLHEQGFVHKDLKPENILVDRDFHIKIADLGVASFKSWSRLTQEETGRQKQMKSTYQNNAGTLFYMAPEHLRCVNAKPVEKSDVYSFGIVIWAIFANKEPYENGINETQICFGIMNGNRPDIKEITDKCPVEVIDLMKQCWDEDSEKRPTFAEISERYKPFYYENLGKNIEDDLKNLKKMWPETNELLYSMESLEIDAVPEDTSNGQVDQPNSLHSSQGPMTSKVDEALFAASPENQPVESCETSFAPPDNLERKLQHEYNYHAFGSRMDKAVPPVVHSPEMLEEERRRRVSCDPFAKPSPTSQLSNMYPRAEKTGSNTNPYFWPAATTPKWGNVDVFYGPNPKCPPTGKPVDTYGLSSATNSIVNKPPVLESGQNVKSQTNVNWNSKNSDTDTGYRDSTSFTRGTFAYHTSAPRVSPVPYTDDSIKYNINNSSGIQIGSYNQMKIEEQNPHVSTYSVSMEDIYTYYEAAGVFDNTTVLTEKHLNLVRENLAKQWKHCARKLGFGDPEIDEIDHDYERDGLKEKVYQMLLKWVMREGAKGATVGKLAKALVGCRRLDLLRSLMQIQEE
ncbi:Receptor-interacting serine/threonine-protein kinase 1 [Lonchura striata]|uniref:Receptor-interacting serine/threonine-protein kinase 1 n=1 Tax=Lonchura striata TaxID=40157 RepID=A0A218UC58_9PASE|nr:receptor-interacting serine/threonine-protein kinase 1 [Lonchura striata domestica]XP_021400453.1 receptor-interacting serine/threonine-protein kinase 1 [Lonchura striata domestica]XP_021400454.1 receptor-interacting serine/threonine-protein kinase 1 [Lonchura striata domestica]OWK51357.1 Receptor-interacting serine/threonine-protein kinase 1 [Lonchura striata domestica]